MDFKDKLLMLGDRVAKLKDKIGTEESTKTSFVLPFLQNLGYDIFNPLEVTPECDCDYGTKKGEKIDYTVCLDGQPIMLIECKHWREDLDRHKAQLFRYYHVSKAKFGVLTNGIVYKFFSDLESQNKMDDKPFFEINLLDLKDSHIEKLKEFCHDQYNVENILNSATELKYINALRAYIVTESQSPTEDFVKFFTKQVYDGMVTKSVLDDFTPMVKRAFQLFTNDYVNERLKSAITPEMPAVDAPDGNEAASAEESKIITTEEELQGFYIVRAILCNTVDLNRVVDRDAQSYFAILFDNNNRKPICRLHFNGGKKYVETFDANKVGTKHLISSLNDIYQLSDTLINIVEYYLKGKSADCNN
ncbi:type I restriction endonuclease [Alistipes sp.]|uniref:type I restriction endonuclease n=1 Tax=Alistipes sp. TaxID=1872444 RepID=UPI003AB5CD72